MCRRSASFSRRQSISSWRFCSIACWETRRGVTCSSAPSAATIRMWTRIPILSPPTAGLESYPTRRVSMIRLGVNIDHVATVRQARRAAEPDPVAAAVLAVLGGADGITVHLREDRRHIQDRDVRLLRQTVSRLNLELAAVDAIVDIACEIKPDEATLVPERREELTTEGGLDVVAHQKTVARAMQRLRDAGIAVSLFLDPDDRQIDIAKVLGAKAVEIQTASYSEARTDADRDRELTALIESTNFARQ